MAEAPVKNELEVDSIINRLLADNGQGTSKNVVLPEVELKQLCEISQTIFLEEPSLLELDSPLNVIGDIRGDFNALLRVFEMGGHPSENKYLFLGSYVDTGINSIEVISLLLSYKIKYPEQVFLLRGNHECKSISRIYGFYDECKRRCNVKLWKVFCSCFNTLPIAAVVNKSIFCVHGGLSPELNSLDDIRRIERPVEIPNEGLLCDLLWADPDNNIAEWVDSDRGVSFHFGSDAVKRFTEKNGLSLIIRSNQWVDNGYEYMADKKVVTINSRFNHLGEWNNKGGFAVIDANGSVSYQIIDILWKK